MFFAQVHKVRFVASTLLDAVRKAETAPASAARAHAYLCECLGPRPLWRDLHDADRARRGLPVYPVRDREELFVSFLPHFFGEIRCLRLTASAFPAGWTTTGTARRARTACLSSEAAEYFCARGPFERQLVSTALVRPLYTRVCLAGLGIPPRPYATSVSALVHLASVFYLLQCYLPLYSALYNLSTVY